MSTASDHQHEDRVRHEPLQSPELIHRNQYIWTCGTVLIIILAVLTSVYAGLTVSQYSTGVCVIEELEQDSIDDLTPAPGSLVYTYEISLTLENGTDILVPSTVTWAREHIEEAKQYSVGETVPCWYRSIDSLTLFHNPRNPHLWVELLLLLLIGVVISTKGCWERVDGRSWELLY